MSVIKKMDIGPNSTQKASSRGEYLPKAYKKGMRQFIRNQYGMLNTPVSRTPRTGMRGQYKFGAKKLGQIHAEIFEPQTQNFKVMSIVKKMNIGPN